MDDSEETSIKMTEILVALDHSSHSRAALESAAFIAKLMEAKIHGLFVHDDQWLRIGKLPYLAEIDELTGKISPIGRDSIEKKIRDVEIAIKEHFEHISNQYQLPNTLSTEKGVVTKKVLEAAKDVDLITIGSRGRSFSKSGKLGSTASSIIRTADKPVLILQNRRKPNRPTIVVFDGSEKSAFGVKMALAIAGKNDSPLIVIDMSDAFSTKISLDSITDQTETEIQVIKMDQPNMGRFLFLLNRLRGGLLVVPKNDRFTKKSTVEYILEGAKCPILLAS